MRRPQPTVLAAAAILVALASIGCGGSKSSAATTPGNGSASSGSAAGSDGAGSTGDSDRGGESPGARLVELIEKVAAEVTGADDCDQFANALDTWTDRNQAEFEQLVAEVKAEAESGEADPDAARMDEQIVEGYLAVVEAAAECGDNDAAMRAYEAFNATVEKATY